MRGVHLHRGQDGHIEVPVPVAGPAHRHDAQPRTPVLVTVSSCAQKKVFQYDPLVTPESILRAAEQVERLQLKQQKLCFEEHVGVLVLEEVGVPVLPPHNPLMSLHSLLDSGVEVNGLFVHLPSSGSSTTGIRTTMR